MKEIENTIKKICKDNLILDIPERVDTKFNKNRLFKTKDYYIKLYFNNKEKYFDNEYFIYNELKKESFLPKLIKCGKYEDVKYIIITKIEAKTIFEIWENQNDKIKEEIIKQMSLILKKINNLRKRIDNGSFKKKIICEYYDAISNNEMSNILLQKSEFFYKERINLIKNNEKLILTYPDFHFNNFLYDDSKVYIIDFESLQEAPLDYQIASIVRMSKNPIIEAPKNINVNKREYEKIPEYFEKYYKCSEDKRRIELYNFIYDMKAVKHKKASEKIIEKDLKEYDFNGKI